MLVAHMGGPFWAAKDAGAWSIPKGEIADGEPPAAAALREFEEELGRPAPPGELVDLGEIRLRSGKRLTVFALEGDYDATAIESSEFELEWPRGSGTLARFPEVDRAAWIGAAAAREKLAGVQSEFLDRLLRHLAEPAGA